VGNGGCRGRGSSARRASGSGSSLTQTTTARGSRRQGGHAAQDQTEKRRRGFARRRSRARASAGSGAARAHKPGYPAAVGEFRPCETKNDRLSTSYWWRRKRRVEQSARTSPRRRLASGARTATRRPRQRADFFDRIVELVAHVGDVLHVRHGEAAGPSAAHETGVQVSRSRGDGRQPSARRRTVRPDLTEDERRLRALVEEPARIG
jgi:hypothetical protein